MTFYIKLVIFEMVYLPVELGGGGGGVHFSVITMLKCREHSLIKTNAIKPNCRRYSNSYFLN